MLTKEVIALIIIIIIICFLPNALVRWYYPRRSNDQAWSRYWDPLPKPTLGEAIIATKAHLLHDFMRDVFNHSYRAYVLCDAPICDVRDIIIKQKGSLGFREYFAKIITEYVC